MASTNGQQFELLVSFLETNQGLATNRMNSPQFKQTVINLWQEITRKLNELGPSEKSVEGWKKVLKDFKYSIKAKLRTNKLLLSGTGCGPYKLKKFTVLEERMDKILQLSQEIEGTNIPSYGFNDTITTESNLEIITEEPDVQLELTINEEPTITSINRSTTRPLIPLTTTSNTAILSTSTTAASRNHLQTPTPKTVRETSKMLLKKQVELQEAHHKRFKKFAENTDKYQKEKLRILRDIRKIKKEKWAAKQKILIEQNKLKVEELEIKRLELQIREQELNKIS